MKTENDQIVVKNATEHNLKKVSVSIPHNTLTVVTGVSGSGKSSLVFDVIGKEGRRRFLESFSTFARQYMGKMGQAKVEEIKGLGAVIAVDQKTINRNSRSTVGTMTEIYDYLRLLFARAGDIFCLECGGEVTASTLDQIADSIIKRFKDKRLFLLSPVILGHKGRFQRELKFLKNQGIEMVRINQQIVPVHPIPALNQKLQYSIEGVIGEFVPEQKTYGDLKQLIKRSLDFGKGALKLLVNKEEISYSLKHGCVECHAGFVEVGPRLFSFNSLYGACETCQGLGLEERIDPVLVIADENKTLREGALVPTLKNGYTVYSQVTIDVLNKVCLAHGFNVDIPWKDLTERNREVILYGTERIKIPIGKHTLESRMKWTGMTAKPRPEGYYRGIITIMSEILQRDRNKNILRFVSSVTCSSCGGSRIRKEARSIRFRGINIDEMSGLSLSEMKIFFDNEDLKKMDNPVTGQIIDDIKKRLTLLDTLGLSYLTLNRGAPTLSGSEAQRIRLAVQAGTGLSGICYILDEPSVGLHPVDSLKMVGLLKQLVNNGNTVVVVEHDDKIIRNADWIIDLGPGPGVQGGEILFSGTYHDFLNKDFSGAEVNRTLNFLKGKNVIPIPETRRKSNKKLSVLGATENNLKNIDVEFDISCLNIVTGVSGAGKSSLVRNILSNRIKNKLNRSSLPAGECQSVNGSEYIDKIIEIDQSPIGRTPRSNPATYTKLFDEIRSLFAAQLLAKQNKWSKSRFSFNVKGGRCESCSGAGYIQVGMHFLGDVDLLCENCQGRRFNEETLKVKYKNKNIHEVLEMSVQTALTFFRGQAKIVKFLQILNNLGLGYIKIGQPSTTLSGGEAQRVKLASELKKPSTGKTLYILDEPSTGLHPSDIKIFMDSVFELVENKNTVIMIEHDSEIVKCADKIIDLGPGSGRNGGVLLGQADPETFVQAVKSPSSDSLISVLTQAEMDVEKKNYLMEKPDFSGLFYQGVFTNNLKGVSVSIPYNSFTVITGVSGSGKSSLAFDTIYSESKYRFIESLSTYARQMLSGRNKSLVEKCTGLTPAIALSQKMVTHNPRSTVGTLSGIYDHYRLLFSRVGINFCPDCQKELDGLNCKSCDFVFPRQLTAQDFSFNSHFGACPVCNGLGEELVCDPEKLITNPEQSFRNGAMKGHKTGRFYGDPHGQYIAAFEHVAGLNGFSCDLSFSRMSVKQKEIALFGTGNLEYQVIWKYKRSSREGEYNFKNVWRGFANLVTDEYLRKHNAKAGDNIRSLMKEVNCLTCKGTKLNKDVKSIKFKGKSIDELSDLSIDQSLLFFENIDEGTGITEAQLKIINELRIGIIRRMNYLKMLGLGYLSVSRKVSTLSGGETQRLRLGGVLGKDLCGITFVLDEPSLGLHPFDTNNLISILKTLNQMGNTLVIVEHDSEIIRKADYIIDIGPGAGNAGGEIVFEGTFENLVLEKKSVTGKYLNSNLDKSNTSERRLSKSGLSIQGGRVHNLKNINLDIPCQGLIAVTGVSGSGKSSLVFDLIEKSYLLKKSIGCDLIKGFENFTNLISMDANVGSGSSNSNPVIYTGIFDEIRTLFSETKYARVQGLKKSDFSFNTKGGRCESCKGTGLEKINMGFLSDIQKKCDFCQGKRYQNKILDVLINEHSILDILNLSIDEGIGFFNKKNQIKEGLQKLSEVGLGYLKLGQSTSTLSGGERQRLKLVKELISCKNGANLYLFDEPTSGLHPSDIEQLLIIFRRLVSEGHTILVVEHNLDIIKASDFIIDLGPFGGDRGGEVIVCGVLKDVMSCQKSLTGKELCKTINVI